MSDGDLLALDGGLRVRLSEIEAPAISSGRSPYAAEARELLGSVALGRPGRLYYGGLSRDRYERAIAHVIVQAENGEDVWLNGFMARQGGGRVRSWPDNARRVRRLYALEEEARKNRRGLWAFDEYRVRSLDDLAAAYGFVLVEGPLDRLETGADASEALLAGAGIQLFAGAELGKPSDIKLSRGARIRVRGRIGRNREMPVMRLTHWGQVEVLG